MRLYCTGTSIVCVAASASASASQPCASNFDIRITVDPPTSVGRKATMVVLEYSGVEISVRAESS